MAEDRQEPIEYKKIPGRGRSLVAHHRVWQGPDHLLVVTYVGCAEEYKRFYYSDIQAFTIVWTRNYMLWAILLPVLALCFIGMLWNATGEASLVFIGSPLAVIWVAHLAQGPTCTCWIQTRVNKERMRMFTRVSKAKRFWRRIEPFITTVQGPFSLEEMDAEGTFVDRKMRPVPPDLPMASSALEDS